MTHALFFIALAIIALVLSTFYERSRAFTRYASDLEWTARDLHSQCVINDLCGYVVLTLVWLGFALGAYKIADRIADPHHNYAKVLYGFFVIFSIASALWNWEKSWKKPKEAK